MTVLEKEVASREWVREFVEPVRSAVTEIKNSIEKLTGESQALFTAHNSLLEQQAADDRKKREESTPLGLVKKYAPLVTFIGGAIMIYRALGSVIEYWLKAHGQ